MGYWWLVKKRFLYKVYKLIINLAYAIKNTNKLFLFVSQFFEWVFLFKKFQKGTLNTILLFQKSILSYSIVTLDNTLIIDIEQCRFDVERNVANMSYHILTKIRKDTINSFTKNN